MGVSIQDWEKIGRAPVLVFAAVAAADGTTSTEELEAFGFEWMPRLKSFEVGATDLDRALFQWALDEAASHWEVATKMDTERLLRELKSVVKLMDLRFPSDHAQAWKAALLRLGQEVAKASGGFLGLTSAVDASEREVLSRIKVILQDSAKR